jgi:hypothetical protein
MKIHSHRCDYCSNLKGESNHWRLRVPDQDKFTLQSWDDAQADEPGYEHICSESCAAKALSKWMTRPGAGVWAMLGVSLSSRSRSTGSPAR